MSVFRQTETGRTSISATGFLERGTVYPEYRDKTEQ